MKPPIGIPEEANCLSVLVKGKNAPYMAKVWFWQTNPQDPRTIQFGELSDDVKEDWEVRVLPVQFLVRKDLPT